MGPVANQFSPGKSGLRIMEECCSAVDSFLPASFRSIIGSLEDRVQMAEFKRKFALRGPAVALFGSQNGSAKLQKQHFSRGPES